MTTSEIVKSIMKYYGLSQSDLARKVSLTTGQVHDYLTGRIKNITKANALKFTEAYPELNINWLQTGEGQMFSSEPPAPFSDGIELPNAQKLTKNDTFDVLLTELRNDRAFWTRENERYQKIIERQQEQIDRLLNLLEKQIEMIPDNFKFLTH